MRTLFMTIVGTLLVLAYVGLSASRAVYLGHLLQWFDPIIALFAMFAITATFFNALVLARRTSRRQYLYRLRQAWGDVAWSNALTASAWFTTFLAIKHLEPSAQAVITASSQPLLALALVFLVGQRPSVRGLERTGLGLTAIGVTIQLWVVLTGQSAMGAVPSQSIYFGLAMAAACAASLALTRNVTYRLHQKGFTASELMAARFFVLLALAGALRPDLATSVGLITRETVVGMLALAVLGVIVPLYCLQLGQTLCEELLAALLFSLMPAAMLLAQIADPRLSFSRWTLGAIAIATAGTALALIGHRQATVPTTATVRPAGRARVARS